MSIIYIDPYKHTKIGTTDPYFSNVELLLPMDGNNGSTTFTDLGNGRRQITAGGNVQISTSQSKFGGSAAYFDGSGDGLTFSEIAIGALEDCTLECFFYHISGEGLFGTDFFQNWQLLAVYQGQLAAYWNGPYQELRGGTVVSNTWNHAAITRRNGVIRLFLNGVLVDTSEQNSTNNFTIKWVGQTIYRTDFHGYIDEVRITKGVARYISNFAPPTEPFGTQASPPVAPTTDPYFSKVSLLLPFDGANGSTTFTDLSENPIPISVTANGGATISTSQSKYGGSSLLLAGGINYIFDANNKPALTLDADFTVECDIRTTSTASQMVAGSETPNCQVFRINQAGPGSVYFYMSGLSLTTANDLVPINTWVHLALTRSGSTFRLFVNGILSATGTSTNYIVIKRIGSLFGEGFVGNIDNFRVTKGIARYTANFTPPVGPHPTVAPTPIDISSITYSQSSVYSGVQAATNTAMTDGFYTNPSTATAVENPSWVRMDLGGLYEVGSVVIGTATSSIPGGWNKSYTENRAVEHSIDGLDWTPAFNIGTFAENGIYTFSTSFTARYIRIVSYSLTWTAISEFYALAPDQSYTSAPTGNPNPSFSNISLLLPLDSNFVDVSTNSVTVTPVGNTQISSTQSKWGGASAYFDGDGDYLDLPASSLFSFPGDFTIEFWVYWEYNRGSYDTLLEIGQYNNGIMLRPGNNDSYINNSAMSGAFTLTIGTWHHIAVVRSGTSCVIYKDGASMCTGTVSGTINSGPGGSYIGYSTHAGGRGFRGFVDNLRITKGEAIYTGPFTPPTSAFPTSDADSDFSSVSVLLKMDGANDSTTFTDLSNNAFVVSAFGDAKITTTNPKFGSGALLLDGSGDYLTLPGNSVFQFGTGDFTVECWVYLNSGNSNSGLFTFGGTSSGLSVNIYGGQWRVTTSGSDGTSMTSITLGQWQHLAICRENSNLRMFIDGTQVGATLVNTTDLSDNQLKIGYYYNSNYGISGKIDEFRVTKGVARYTNNFTPPTSAFPTS